MLYTFSVKCALPSARCGALAPALKLWKLNDDSENTSSDSSQYRIQTNSSVSRFSVGELLGECSCDRFGVYNFGVRLCRVYVCVGLVRRFDVWWTHRVHYHECRVLCVLSALSVSVVWQSNITAPNTHSKSIRAEVLITLTRISDIVYWFIYDGVRGESVSILLLCVCVCSDSQQWIWNANISAPKHSIATIYVFPNVAFRFGSHWNILVRWLVVSPCRRIEPFGDRRRDFRCFGVGVKTYSQSIKRERKRTRVKKISTNTNAKPKFDSETLRVRTELMWD